MIEPDLPVSCQSRKKRFATSTVPGEVMRTYRASGDHKICVECTAVHTNRRAALCLPQDHEVTIVVPVVIYHQIKTSDQVLDFQGAPFTWTVAAGRNRKRPSCTWGSLQTRFYKRGPRLIASGVADDQRNRLCCAAQCRKSWTVDGIGQSSCHNSLYASLWQSRWRQQHACSVRHFGYERMVSVIERYQTDHDRITRLYRESSDFDRAMTTQRKASG